MPLGVREILLLIRAKDQASRVISDVGASFGTLNKSWETAGKRALGVGAGFVAAGVAIGGAGVLALGFFNKAANTAAEYNREVALTLTQTDKGQASFAQLSKIGLDVARNFPVAFDKVQASLYDIFSSMDVSVPQARKVLIAFAKGAVAGQTDIQTAGRATIAILNAFKIPVGDVNRIMDLQFQLVKKGVGTYQEFATTIGRAIPSTVKAGQNVYTLAGALAFLTRQGQSTAMASTATARMMDALSNPKSVANLKKLGIQVVDAKGHYRSFVDVLGEMAMKLGSMPPADRVKALATIFKGSGGTIQAFRALIPILNNFSEFKKLTDSMGHSGGAMGAAFKTMMDQPSQKMARMKNQWHAMMVDIGNIVLPIKEKIIDFLSKVFNWISRLSPQVKKFIVIGMLLATMFGIVTGAILVIVGAFIMLDGVAAILGFATMLPLIGIIAGVVAAIIAIVAIIILAVKYHKQIAAIAKQVWHDIQDAVGVAASYIAQYWSDIVDALTAAWDTVYRDVLSPFFDWFDKKIMPAIDSFVQMMKDAWMRVVQILKYAYGIFKVQTQFIIVFLKMAWNAVLIYIRVVFAIWKNLFIIFMAVVKAIWWPLWNWVLSTVKTIWNLIKGVIEGAFKILKGIFDFFDGLLTLNWSKMWNGIKEILSGAWKIITTLVKAAWHIFSDFIANSFDALLRLFKSLPGKILHALGNMGKVLLQAGKDLIQGLINGIKSMGGLIGSAIKSVIPGPLKSLASHLPGPLGHFFSSATGRRLMPGEWSTVGERGYELINALPGGGVRVYSNPRSKSMMKQQGGGATVIAIHPGAVQVNLNGPIDSASMPEVHKAIDDAFSELARKLS